MTLALATTQTVAGLAGTASVINYTLFGDEVGASGDAFKVLAQGQLSASAAVLYTVPASTQAIVKSMCLINTSGSNVAVAMHVNGTATVNRIASINIPANGMATWDGRWTVYDANGYPQTAGATGPQGSQGIQGIQGIQGPAGNPTGPNAIDNTMLVDMVTATIKGRVAAGTGDPQDLTVAQVQTLLGLGSAAYTASTAYDAAGAAATAQANAIAASQPLDADLTAIAALTTTSFGRDFNTMADAAASRTKLALGTAATQPSTAFEVAGAAATAQANAIAASQPVDSDLTAIAALTTTAYGRTLLTLADAAAETALLNVATSTLKGLMSAAMFNSINNGDISAVNILDYGADRLGTAGTEAQNATAWTNALAALPATGGVIYFPFGTYNFNTTLNPGGKSVRIVGDNWAQSIIQSTHVSNDLIKVDAAWNCGVENVQVQGVNTTITGVVTAAQATLPVAELANFPASGSVSQAGTGAWATVTYTGKSAASGAGNLTGCTGVIAATAGMPVTVRTGGYLINLPAGVNYNWVNNVKVAGAYNGINFANALGYIDTVEIRQFRNFGIFVDGNNDKFINRLTTASTVLGAAAVEVNQTSSLLLQQCQILNGAIGLDLNPPNGVTIPSVEAINCFFDNNTIGMRVNGTGTGSCYRSKFTNCWYSSSSTAGIQFNTTNFDGFTFVNCDIYGNGIGISANIVGGGHWSIQASRIAGNTTGISITASAAHFPVIIGNEIGPTGAFGVNGTGIIVAAGTYKGLIIANNAVVNNTTNATLGAVTVAGGAAEAGWYRIIDNAGINPLTGAAVTTPAVPASTAVVTNTTGRRVSVFVKWGATTAPTVVTVNGVAVTAFIGAASTVERFTLEPGGTFAVTYTIAFTWVWVGN